MTGRKPPSESLLKHAAELRAAGNSWEAIARQLKRSANTISKWPQRFPERWQKALKRAQRYVIGNLAGEGLHILRELLRDKDGRRRHEAAAFLNELRLKQALFDHKTGADEEEESALTPEAVQAIDFIKYLDKHTNEEIQEMIDAVHLKPKSDPDAEIVAPQTDAA